MINRKKKIYLFWWSSVKFENRPKENFGDILSKYLVEKISKKTVVWKQPKKVIFGIFKQPIYVVIGSILAHVNENCIVWGSGIISKKDKVKNAKFLAVRGPETYKYLKNKGFDVKPVFGDPAILLPRYFNPKTISKYEFGIIPHYIDFENVNSIYSTSSEIKVINLLNNNVEEVVKEILECKKIISSSLHGIIVSHTYNIPCIWVEFSNNLSGDGIKFIDYFKSVGLNTYKGKYLREKLNSKEINELFYDFPYLPAPDVINKLGKKLLLNCPFNNE
ncbi:polysaccharide pyruvyl transferase family protein [Lacinutrix salivirga]